MVSFERVGCDMFTASATLLRMKRYFEGGKRDGPSASAEALKIWNGPNGRVSAGVNQWVQNLNSNNIFWSHWLLSNEFP